MDEAGRGSVLGPLVLCGVLFDEVGVRRLSEVGVRDSKSLARRRRVEVKDRILELASSFYVVEVPPREIDEAVRRGRLNVLEALYFSRIVERLKPDLAYVDSPLRDTGRFSRMVSSMSSWRCRVLALCHADSLIPVVSAASVLAKVRRDEVLEGYRRVYGDLGSGYPSDPKTVRFLEGLFSGRFRVEEGIVRRSWVTVRRVKAMVGQSRLNRFL